MRGETKAYEMCLRPEKEYEEIRGPAIPDYVRQNQKAWLPRKCLRIEKPCETIRSDEIESMFEQGLGDGRDSIRSIQIAGLNYQQSALTLTRRWQ